MGVGEKHPFNLSWGNMYRELGFMVNGYTVVKENASSSSVQRYS